MTKKSIKPNPKHLAGVVIVLLLSSILAVYAVKQKEVKKQQLLFEQEQQKMFKLADKSSKQFVISRQLEEEQHLEEVRIRSEHIAKLKEEERLRQIAIQKEKEEKERLRKLEEKRIARQKEKESQPQLASRGSEYKGAWKTTEATHYSLGNTGGDVPACGVINLQQTGTHYQGMRIIAANTNLYPCGSVLEIQSKLGTEKAIVMDTGGFLKSKPNNIDILVRTEKEAYALGRYPVKMRVLRKGW